MYIYIYICIYTYTYIYMCVCICIYKEREGQIERVCVWSPGHGDLYPSLAGSGELKKVCV